MSAPNVEVNPLCICASVNPISDCVIVLSTYSPPIPAMVPLPCLESWLVPSQLPSVKSCVIKFPVVCAVVVLVVTVVVVSPGFGVSICITVSALIGAENNRIAVAINEIRFLII